MSMLSDETKAILLEHLTTGCDGKLTEPQLVNVIEDFADYDETTFQPRAVSKELFKNHLAIEERALDPAPFYGSRIPQMELEMHFSKRVWLCFRWVNGKLKVSEKTLWTLGWCGWCGTVAVSGVTEKALTQAAYLLFKDTVEFLKECDLCGAVTTEPLYCSSCSKIRAEHPCLGCKRPFGLLKRGYHPVCKKRRRRPTM